MVKLKEGVVLTADEQRWYDHMNALPRKTSGRVAYYFKPQTKYPARIYVFFHHESWPQRNRRPMGLHHAFPFFDRPMSQEEIEYHHFDSRLCYRQYENWTDLLADESVPADELEEESQGAGAAILEQLSTFRRFHTLHPDDSRQLPVRPPEEIILHSDENQVIEELIRWQRFLRADQLSRAISGEFLGGKRKKVMTALNYLFRQVDRNKKRRLTADWLTRQVYLGEERSRKNFVRRTAKANPLFALEEIRKQHTYYTEQQLVHDLKRGKKKAKRKKNKPILDFRRKQLEKLSAALLSGTLTDQEYHHTCNRIALFQNAHNQRLPIRLSANLQGQIEVYVFPWQTPEEIIKTFVALANSEGMTHALLLEKKADLLKPTTLF